MKANTKLEEEREAAIGAKAVLSGLTPASVRTDRIVFVLRSAANVATRAAHVRLEHRQALNELRSQAAKLLNAVCGLLERNRLDQTSIDQGKAAVQAWLDALSQEDGAEMSDWSDEETDNPRYADDRFFYKVEKWTKDGSKVDRLLYAGNNLDKARLLFEAAIKHRPRIRLTIRQRTRVVRQWPEE